MAPPYAILFMDKLEKQILECSPYKPLVWWRYIDDVLMVWQHGRESLQQFLGFLKITSIPAALSLPEYSNTNVNFLDVQVFLEGNYIKTDLYIKPTDTHQYLEASSCHPYHAKSSIPYSQALRLNRICSEGKMFDKRCKEGGELADG